MSTVRRLGVDVLEGSYGGQLLTTALYPALMNSHRHSGHYGYVFADVVVLLRAHPQEIFDTGIKLLPRSSVVSIMRMALRATATACMRTFSPDGVKAFNMYAVEKLAHNLLTIERFASRCTQGRVMVDGAKDRNGPLLCWLLCTLLCRHCVAVQACDATA